MKEEKGVVAQTFLPTLYAIAIATNMDEVKQKGKYRFPIYINSAMHEADLECLELGARAYNCLRRIGCHTVGDLAEAIDSDEDLKRIKNCGKTSIAEIMNSLLCYQYEILSSERRKKYIDRINELNKVVCPGR